ncbi:hypothetical protein HPB50_028656 [Hyalomma asiaticum]|nr:hypothetical protein HPB50_028656 [Hyalomma asiaticum]
MPWERVTRSPVKRAPIPARPEYSDALLELQQPIFSSENREWQEFWEHCQVTIHTHPELTDIKMFKYLSSYLARAVKHAIEEIRLIDANNSIAVQALTNLYG